MTTPPTTATRFDRLRAFARARPIAAAGIAVTVLCALMIVTIDPWIAQWAKSEGMRDWRKWFRGITDYGKADLFIYCGLAALILGRALFLQAVPKRIAYLYHRIAEAGLYLLVTFIASGIFIHTLKATLGRLRPKHLFQDDAYGFGYYGAEWTNNAFPSGHTQTAFNIAVILTILFPRAWPLFFGFAGLIGLSRVMVTAHYPSDVLMGAYIGIVVALLVKRRWFAHLDGPVYPTQNTFDGSSSQKTTASTS